MTVFKTEGDLKYLASILLAISFIFANSDATKTFVNLHFSLTSYGDGPIQLERAFRVTFAGSVLTSIALLGFIIYLNVPKKAKTPPTQMPLMNAMGK